MKSKEVDYSEIYRREERKKLNTRINKIRNILYICAFALLIGGLIFWLMKIPAFTTKRLLMYFLLSIVVACLGFLCYKKPYTSVISALVICILFWSAELILNKTDNLFIEGFIQKIFVVSLLSSCLNFSKEAEIIRKELSLS
jgi:K+-sensing histidine kinase KdpD